MSANPQSVRFATNQRFIKVSRLFERDIRGHRRFVRIDKCFDYHRTRCGERLFHDCAALRGIFWDAIPAFFDLLREETEPSVRVVLGHFVFVYIHPYMDGNGRIGRFLMNVMMASGGYPWTVIPVGARNMYVEALEKASVGEDIVPFTKFLAGLVRKGLAGEPLPAVPEASAQVR